MTDLNHAELYIGRANTVLVFDSGDNAKAVTSSIVVRSAEQSDKERIRFTGPAFFDDKTVNHILNVILPIVDRICKSLGLSRKNFEMSLVSLNAASIMDVGMNVSGYSADVPIALAMLSACLAIAIPQNMAFTGHIASIDGDIRMVKSLPAKLKAAIQNEEINIFIHPVLDKDSSLASFSPSQKELVSGAISEAKRLIRTEAVNDLSELIPKVFSDGRVVSSSLRQDYYQVSFPFKTNQTPVERATQYLAVNHADRFWKALSDKMLSKRSKNAGELLLRFVQYHIRHNRYPEGLGKSLLQLLCSLPPDTRRLKIDFPVIPISTCIQLSQFASDFDYEDVPLLFQAVTGRLQVSRGELKQRKSKQDPEDDNGARKLQLILSELNEEVLTLIGVPIDTARATYVMESIKAESHDAFFSTITSFYIHLMRYTGKIYGLPDRNTFGAEALALVQRTFSADGGFRKAVSQAIDGTQGGLRAILDMMTARFKREEQEKHVNMVLKMALDPLKFEDKTDLIKALLDRLSSHLPPAIVSQPPERYAAHYEAIIKAYVQSMDQMKTVLRSL